MNSEKIDDSQKWTVVQHKKNNVNNKKKFTHDELIKEIKSHFYNHRQRIVSIYICSPQQELYSSSYELQILVFWIKGTPQNVMKEIQDGLANKLKMSLDIICCSVTTRQQEHSEREHVFFDSISHGVKPIIHCKKDDQTHFECVTNLFNVSILLPKL